MKDFGENVKKLPLYVGQKMMDMVHHLNENHVQHRLWPEPGLVDVLFQRLCIGRGLHERRDSS